ncbi:transcription initiation factor TFIID [Ordospora pajunii]|jgi:transcription initiation factor TFIID subunit 7|uniref:transcription initiation factor TFIID n=1 Tax=Ordospora pajunii TaxID=3039483 RepID=UPI0029526873|nr:transcription initiation factor TFIID [Ordospora pajunii]KAH9412304.1 transcription initiation factor TFIID [Ordospora pajunii]
MEQQFILRLHESIRHVVDLKESLIDIQSNGKAVLTHKLKKYPCIVVRLPCIVESQKSMDNRQYYKVADISALVVVYPHDGFDFDREREIHEMCGLSPPLKYAKARRFRKRSSKIEHVEEIERRVNELLEKDIRAKSVEIVSKDDKEVSDDLDTLAAEIENKFVDRIEVLEKDVHDETDVYVEFKEAEEKLKQPRSKELELLEGSVEEKRKQVENALNPILKKRFESQLFTLLGELEDLKKRLGIE